MQNRQVNMPCPATASECAEALCGAPDLWLGPHSAASWQGTMQRRTKLASNRRQLGLPFLTLAASRRDTSLRSSRTSTAGMATCLAW